MTSWDGLDRRRFPRVVYPSLIVVGSGDKDDKDVILTHTENVGVGGMCVILKKNVKVFSSVEIELDLLDLSNHIKCHGKIVWNVQRKDSEKKKPLSYDVGIEFQDLNKKEQARLEAIVNRLAEEHEEPTTALDIKNPS